MSKHYGLMLRLIALDKRITANVFIRKPAHHRGILNTRFPSSKVSRVSLVLVLFNRMLKKGPDLLHWLYHPLDHIFQIIRLQAEIVHADIISG
jgi:hypothetical protein